MRSLQECQAEVFRRSEKRIRTRRRAIRAVMVCAPLVLCLTAFGLSGRETGSSQFFFHIIT